MNQTIRGIARGNVKTGKTRSILTGVAIFLSTMLLTVLAISVNGMIQSNTKNAKELYGTFSGAFVHVQQNQLTKIRKRAELFNIGMYTTFAEVEMDAGSAELYYIDSKACESENIQPVKGRMPETKEELCAQKEFFKANGYPQAKLGDTVTLSYRNQGKGKILTKKFTISGFLKSPNKEEAKRIYQVMVSKAFFESSIPEEQRSYTVLFNLYKEKEYGFDGSIDKMNTIARDLEITKEQVAPNSLYLIWVVSPSNEILIGGCIIGAIIILFSILVIYNIFYVGMIRRIQDYGRLRAIGITKRQLKHLILLEGFYVAIPAVAAGLLVGILGAYLFDHYWWNIVTGIAGAKNLEPVNGFSLPLVLLSMGLSFLTVYFSLQKPMGIASKVSPVEAIRYGNGTKKKKAKTRKGYQMMNLSQLTVSGLSYNRKRTLMTILTMGISCILFVVIANFVHNIDPKYAARDIIQKGDFSIDLDADLNDDAYPEKNYERVQASGILASDFKNSLKKIDGVNKVEERKIIKGEVLDASGKPTYFTFGVLSKKEFQKIAEDVVKGEVDYQKASQENGVIYTNDLWMRDYDLEQGKSYSFSLYDGEQKIPLEGTIQGTLDEACDVDFYITEDTVRKLGFQKDITGIYWVFCDKNKEADVYQNILTLTQDSKFYRIVRYTEELKKAKGTVLVMQVPAYALLALLGIIGFLNMANTLITSMVTRKQEFGVLQAIGLTRQQLNRMLQMEGILVTMGTLIMALVLGNAVGYVMFLRAKNHGWFGLNVYHFPAIEMLCMCGLLILLQVVLSFFLSRNLKKESIIERIRYQG